jgi:hypothetical protein
MFRIAVVGDLKSNRFNPLLTPIHMKFAVPVKITAIDLGGAGDCFLRCFNMGMAAYTDFVPSMEDYYSLLGLPLNSFLEEDSLATLAVRFKYNFIVYRVGTNMPDSIVFFDTGADRTLSFVNYYPNHFLFVEHFNIEGVNFTEINPYVNQSWFREYDQPGLPAEIESFYRDYKSLIIQDTPLVEQETEEAEPLEFEEVEEMLEPEYSEEEEGEREGDSEITISLLHPDSTISNIYAYLVDSDRMVIDSPGLLIDIYYTTHNIYVDKLLKINDQSLVPPPDFLKAYSKFRHNVFASICIMSLNKGSPLTLSTDVSLSQWLPDSKKTPDYIVEVQTEILEEGSHKSKIYILEFTVGNKYETIDMVKGGGSFDVKYQSEINQMQEKGIDCEVLIVPAVLDVYNVDEIFSLLAMVKPVEDYRFHLNRFFEIANNDRSIINLNYIQSNMSYESVEFEIEGLEWHTRPLLNCTILVSPETVSVLSTSFDYLLFRIEYLLDRDCQHVSMNYNLDTNKIFLRPQKKGVHSLVLRDVLLKKSMPDLIPYIEFFQDKQKIALHQLRGSVPVTYKPILKESKSRHWQYNPTVDVIYTRSEPIVDPGYGQLKNVDILSCKKLGSSNKVSFPEDYFEKLCSLNLKKLADQESPDMLANNPMTKKQIVNAVEIFDKELLKSNKVDFIFSPKPTFILPPISKPLEKSPLDVFNKEMCKIVIDNLTGDYTKRVLRKVISGDFVKVRKQEFNQEMEEVRQKLIESRRTYYTYLLDNKMKGRFSELSDLEKEKVLPYHNKMIQAHREYTKKLGTSKGVANIGMIKIHCGRKTTQYDEFQHEMGHFKTTGYKGVGLLAEDENVGFDKYIKDLCMRLVSKEFHDLSLDSLYNTVRLPGPEFLTQLKDDYTHSWTDFYDKFIRGTMLELWSDFSSRLSETLFNESVKSYNKDYVKVDNLGYNNVIVLIRGGSKIYKNQTSRLFRLILYISEDDQHYTGYSQSSSFQLIPTKNGLLLMTPWSQIRQDMLFDMISFRERVFLNLYSVHKRCRASDTDLDCLQLLPTILFFHNRRKTESFMHNSRYLIVNPLAKYANITGIVKSFATFNYTYLDSWLKFRISKGYVNFATSIMTMRENKGRDIDNLISSIGLKDIWFNNPIINCDHLTVLIYVTYMMTKAPVNSSIEQANNLWEILADVKDFEEMHGDVDGLNDKSLRFNILDCDTSSYKDDFKYDPVYCQFLGHSMSSYLLNISSSIEMANHWSRLKNQDLDSIANSKGLRGWNKKNFFNKKGYEIVYQHVMEVTDVEDLERNLNMYTSSDLFTAKEMVKSDKIVLPSNMLKKLLFHVVHKIQRGGGREIFCMDIGTKAQQSPLEKMFKFICKKLPNEYISIPSNKRHSLIHSEFYDKGPGRWTKKVIRWVLDCRRWAPHSVFQKYVHFIIGLAPILPADFISCFKEFSEKMYKKEFVTRRHVLSKMVNNERFEVYKDLEGLRGELAEMASFTVKFSFVMGIFNYLSTLMHSANQMVATEIVRNICLRNNHGLVMLNAKCHSDDSVVSSYHEKEESVKPSLLLYDWLLKGANHMLSVKKSQVNEDTYLEFLSILYLFNRFLPVVPKFTSSIPFKPSDKGYSSDISFAITQSVEMLTQGGNLDESFLILKITERFVQKVYRITPVSNLPFNFLGMIDSHPVELLLAGGLADLTRSIIYNPDQTWAAFNFLRKNNFIDPDTVDFSLQWDMGSKISDRLLRKFQVFDKAYDKVVEIAPWTISNSKMGNAKLNLLWYMNKLRDKLFYSSLVDEPISRRYSRIFGSANYRPVVSSTGDMVIAQALAVALNSIDPTQVDCLQHDSTNEFLMFINNDLQNFYKSVAETKIMGIEACNVKEKPILFSGSESMLGNLNMSASDYVIYKKEPLGYKLLGKSGNPYREAQKVDAHLKILGFDSEELSKDKLYKMTRLLFKEESRSYRLISVMRGDSRSVNNYSDMLTFIEYNTIKSKRIILKNKKAAILDWERRIKQGNVPQSVTDYMKCYWTCYVLQNYGVIDKDIFSVNPKQKELELAGKIPQEWRLLVLSSTDTESIPLADLSYWSYWSKEQIKIGNKWYGKGSVIVKCPEAVFKMEIDNGTISNILIETDHKGVFSMTTCWYLSAFFNFTGLVYSMTPSEHGLPGTMYLGYTFHNNSYGFGFASSFDSIFYYTKEQEALLPSFTFDVLKRKLVGKIFTYFDPVRDNEYKVEFFLPSSTPVTMEVSEYLDKKKLQQQMKSDSSITEFVKQLSVDLTGFIKIDKQFLFDNLGRSLIYKVMHNLENSTEVYLQTNTKANPFFRSLIKWKAEHPDFGFPSEGELVDLCKRDDVPPIPYSVYQMLVNLGHSTIADSEFSRIVSNVLHMEPENRESYLMENFPFLNNNEVINTIVISMRSERAYDSFRNCNAQSLKMLCPLIVCISEAVDKYFLNSSKIKNIKGYFVNSRAGTKTDGFIFEVIASRFFMNLISYSSSDGTFDRLHKLFFDILTEFLEDGLLNHLNECTEKHPLLKSVEFQVPRDKFMYWVLDMTTGLSFSSIRGVMVSRETERSLYGNNGKLLEYVTNLRSHFVKLKQKPQPKMINVTLGRKHKRRMKLMEEKYPTIGVTLLDFCPQTEDSLDEFESYYYNEDAHEDVEFDEEAEIPEIAYVTVPYLNEKALFRVRGTAWVVVVGTKMVDTNIFQVTGKKKFFRSNTSYQNIYKTVDSMCDYIAVFSKNNLKIEIESYKEIPWEEQNKSFMRSPYLPKPVHIEGKDYYFEEIDSNPSLAAHLINSDQFFKNPEAESVKKEIVLTKKQINLVEKTGRKVTKEFERLKKQLDDDLKVLSKTKDKVEEKSESEPVDLNELLTRTMKGREDLFFALEGDSTQANAKKQFIADYKPYRYDGTLNLLTDIRFRSEFEVLFPGYWDMFANKEIRMSARNKKHRLEFARLRIDKMPREMRRNYRKLFLICSFVLENVAECPHRQNESHDFGSLIDDLFDADYESDEERIELVNDLIPDHEDLTDFYDLSWLT